MTFPKIYIPENLLDRNVRTSWFEPVKSKLRFDEKPLGPDAELQSRLHYTDNVDEADLIFLPMDWNFYYRKKQAKEVIRQVNQWAESGKKVWSYTGGDYGITLPVRKNVTVFRQSGYTQRFPDNHKGFPVMITDPVQRFYNSDENVLCQLPEENHKTITFCGHAYAPLKKRWKEKLQIALFNLARMLNLHPFDRQDIVSSTGMRVDILDRLENAPELRTNFIRRQVYRAGASGKEERFKTNNTYFDNVLSGMFVLCVRGNGNFSVRFYEALAMGRVPIYINTGTPMPDISPLKWDDHMLTIEPGEINQIPTMIEEFLKDKKALEIVKTNRALWREKLSMVGFWQNEINRIKA